jgi:hypothetical protein
MSRAAKVKATCVEKREDEEARGVADSEMGGLEDVA